MGSGSLLLLPDGVFRGEERREEGVNRPVLFVDWKGAGCCGEVKRLLRLETMVENTVGESGSFWGLLCSCQLRRCAVKGRQISVN